MPLLKVIDPEAAVVLPLGIEDAKTHLRLTEELTADDSYLLSLIAGAAEWAEKHLGQALITAIYELSLDEWPAGVELSLEWAPVVAVTSVTYTDYLGNATVWPASNYLVDIRSDPGRLVLAYGKSWPSVTLAPVNGVVVRFTAGYGDDASAIPESFKQAMRLYLTQDYENRAPGNIDLRAAEAKLGPLRDGRL